VRISSGIFRGRRLESGSGETLLGSDVVPVTHRRRNSRHDSIASLDDDVEDGVHHGALPSTYEEAVRMASGDKVMRSEFTG
jgi:hypothetical protein